jgi:hypothetical protein
MVSKLLWLFFRWMSLAELATELLEFTWSATVSVILVVLIVLVRGEGGWWLWSREEDLAEQVCMLLLVRMEWVLWSVMEEERLLLGLWWGLVGFLAGSGEMERGRCLEGFFRWLAAGRSV